MKTTRNGWGICIQMIMILILIEGDSITNGYAQLIIGLMFGALTANVWDAFRGLKQ